MTHAVVLNDVAYYKHPTPTRAAGGHVIASALRDSGYECKIIDWFTLLDEELFDIIKSLSTENTKLLAISATFLAPKESTGYNALSEATGLGTFKLPVSKKIDETVFEKNLYMWLETEKNCKEWFARLKEILPGVTIVLGGARISRVVSLLEKTDYYTNAYEDVDYFVLGEGERIITQIADSIFKNTETNFNAREIKGCTFLAELTQMSSIPRIYHTKDVCIEPNEWLPLEISRGCRFNCAFCNYEKNVYRKKDKKTLVDELTRNYELFGTQGYNLTTDCLTDSKQYVDIFCDALSSLYFSVDFSAYARVDLLWKYSDMFDQLLEVGFKAGWFGVETFNHDAGKAIRKGLHPDKVKEILKNIRYKADEHEGFWLLTCLIFGLPKETIQSLENTLQWYSNQEIIDEVSVSVLDFAEFSENLEGITNYSDISINPKKFGFTKLSFSPFFWEHGTMNITQATELKDKFRDLMAEHSYTRFGGGATFEYPAIRSLGFTHKQTTQLLKNKFVVGKNLVNIDKKTKKRANEALLDMSKKRLQDYYKNLLTTEKIVA